MVSKNYLESLLSKQATKNTGSKSQLESVVMYLGVKPKAHYANLKDSNGDLYTFSEIGTSKMVKVVYISDLPLEIGTLYHVSGLGYDMRKSNMLLIDEASEIEAIEEEV